MDSKGTIGIIEVMTNKQTTAKRGVLAVDGYIMHGEVPPWFPSDSNDICQIEGFVRWVLHVHHRANRSHLMREMARSLDPFRGLIKRADRTKSAACFELAHVLIRTLGLEISDIQGLTEDLIVLSNTASSKEGETPEWFVMANQIRDEWTKRNPLEDE